MSKRWTSKRERARLAVREEKWPDAQLWMWPPESGGGWAKVPRVLALILQILRLKTIRGKEDPGSVYVELLTHVWGEGVFEIEDEHKHAEAAGYLRGARQLRTWRERMRALVDLGFIRTAPHGTSEFGYVIVVNPYIAIEQLYRQNKIEEGWWLAFRERWVKEGGEIPTERKQFDPLASFTGAIKSTQPPKDSA
jgi:hypothetical protein